MSHRSGYADVLVQPPHAGFIVSNAGLAIICATALAISAVGFFVIGLWLKARLEEQFLSDELGAASYATYMTQTPMLVPRLPRPSSPR
jgi:protein-S-isoprenylcysteine O-methyltransferase Ste14